MVPSCWFLVCVWWLPLLLAAGSDEQQQRLGDDSCSPKMCGSVNISSPFWLTYWDEPQAPCRSSDFEVTCVNSTTPILRNAVSIDQGFAIKDISYKESSLRVVDLYAQNAYEVCLGRNLNASVKVDPPFKISPSNLNLALYNCTAAATAQAREDTELVEMGACGSKSSVFVRGAGGRYDANRSYAGYYREGCNATIVPVLGTSDHEANPSDYKQLISYGFLLTWDLHPRPLPVVPGNNTDTMKFLVL